MRLLARNVALACLKANVPCRSVLQRGILCERDTEADTLARVQVLRHELEKIDRYVGQLLGLSNDDIGFTQGLVEALIQRRTLRAQAAKPEFIVGEETLRVKLPKPSERIKGDVLTAPLDRWT